ncbi:hypothetical protein D1007_61155 [Hordeum vulgare]|nr:hypothetical protein D1007_61155 [Hordeum vulgare]
MTTIAFRSRVDTQSEDVDVLMEAEATNDPTLPSSSCTVAPPSSSIMSPSPVHYTMTIGEAHARYMDIVREKRFREAQEDTAYNHHLLQEHP